METAKIPHVSNCLEQAKGPVIAASDYTRAFAEQIRAYIPSPYTVLGTDGFGRSDTRSNLRKFFEVDRFHITVAALKSLADLGELEGGKVAEAIAKYHINADVTAPWLT
jgi:pyruvate dehydrogenase E1 component